MNTQANDDDKFDYYNDSGSIHGNDIDNDDNYEAVFFLIFSCFINQPIAVTVRSTEFGLELTRHKREAVLPKLS